MIEDFSDTDIPESKQDPTDFDDTKEGDEPKEEEKATEKSKMPPIVIADNKRKRLVDEFWKTQEAMNREKAKYDETRMALRGKSLKLAMEIDSANKKRNAEVKKNPELAEEHGITLLPNMHMEEVFNAAEAATKAGLVGASSE